MDSLTQIVLGAAVGEVVLGKKVGNKAALYGAIAGTIPDLDVLSRSFVDIVTATEWHRGFSHSIIFSCLMAVPLGWLISKIERRSPANYRDWSKLMFWGLLTHPILDMFTTWGTQLFWPLDWRIAFKNIFVIDPLYTLPFLILLILALRLPRTSPRRRKLNKLGILFSSSYLLITLILKGITYKKFEISLKEQGIVYSEISTRTTPFNSLLWTANVDIGDAYLIGNYSLFDTKPILFRRFSKDHQLLGELVTNEKVQRLIAIAQGWYIISKVNDQLLFNDLRFGLISLDPGEGNFVFSYILSPDGDELSIEETPKTETDVNKLFSVLWGRIWGN
ncbi:MAG: metal-dependent hydrolase [Flavobacteriaceae bacterium]